MVCRVVPALSSHGLSVNLGASTWLSFLGQFAFRVWASEGDCFTSSLHAPIISPSCHPLQHLSSIHPLHHIHPSPLVDVARSPHSRRVLPSVLLLCSLPDFTLFALFPSLLTFLHTMSATQHAGQPERITVASLAPPQRTAAEQECKKQSTQGMMIGSGGTFVASYLAHKAAEANCQPPTPPHTLHLFVPHTHR
jgi:hypothetical protein